LLLLLTLQLHPRLDAGPRAHKRVVVSRFRHVSVIQPSATRTQQEECFDSNLWQQRNFIWVWNLVSATWDVLICNLPYCTIIH
jgi:hypothetical protein